MQKDERLIRFDYFLSSFILGPMARKNILVVDDEKSQREILEMILAEEGYDVTTAASGEAAIKFAKERTI